MTVPKKPTLVRTPGTAARQKTLHTFHVEIHSEGDDMTYKGKFTVKKLSLRDLAALGVRKSQLQGGLHFDPSNPGRGVDEITDQMNTIIAQCEFSIVEAPEWWDLGKITDMEVLYKVYEEVISFENSFHGPRRSGNGSTAGGTGQGDGPGDSSSSDHGGMAGSVVEQEVLDPLEP